MTVQGQAQRRRKTDPLLPPRNWINPRAAELLAAVFGPLDPPATQPTTTERTHPA